MVQTEARGSRFNVDDRACVQRVGASIYDHYPAPAYCKPGDFQIPMPRLASKLKIEFGEYACRKTVDNGRVVSLKENLKLEPSTAELADLPVGWKVSRDASVERWHRCESDE